MGAAHNVFCDGLEPHHPFPLDRQWICATNKFMNQINHHLQQWRTQDARSFGIISVFIELIKPLSNCSGLSKAQQIDFAEKIDTPDLPSNDRPILKGDPFVWIRKIGTRSGLVKGRRCCVTQIKNRIVVFQFEDGETRELTRISMEKTSNWMKFIRCQLLLRPIFAGTVHRPQGMTLQRAGIDYRTKFWEHGQLYVALSRVKSPGDLCILLPADMDGVTIRPPVDLDVDQILETMESLRALPIPQISPDHNVKSGVSSINPSDATLAKELPCSNDCVDAPRIRLILFAVSTMMLLKYLTRAPMRYPSMFRSCHGSLRTDRCLDLIVSEILYLKAIYPDLLCLLRRFSVRYFKRAVQNSCQ
jgi:hypothetical protein